MDSTIRPIGEWAPIDAERLHFLEGLVPPRDWADLTTRRVALTGTPCDGCAVGLRSLLERRGMCDAGTPGPVG